MSRRRPEEAGQGATAVSLVDDIYRRLADEILDGALKPGQQLTVSTITQRMRVSAVPIREALRRLEGERLVEFENNRGARVTEISLDDLRDIYAARRVAEPAALRAAVSRGSIDVEAVTTAFERMAEAYRSGQQKDGYLWHRRFHQLLADTGTSPRLEQFVITLLDASGRYLRLTPGIPRDADVLIDLHRTVLDAVISADADAAAEEMVRHMDYSIDHLAQQRIQRPEDAASDLRPASR